jgi:hypothetical protein
MKILMHRDFIIHIKVKIFMVIEWRKINDKIFAPEVSLEMLNLQSQNSTKTLRNKWKWLET